MGDGILYTNVRGFPVNRLSHSQYVQYRESPAKYKWRRLYGWVERVERAAQRFGDDLQEAVRRMYIRQINPVAEFAALWEARKAQELDYGDSSWEKILEQGRGLMGELALRRDEFPVRHPRFFSYRDKNPPTVRDAASGCEFMAIPDLMDKDERGVFLADIKALQSPLKADTPGIVALDQQLLTQAAVMGVARVALWVFIKSLPKREKNVPEPRYRIQWLEAEVSTAHAQDALRDELSVIPQIQAGWFPCKCGVRWPNDQGPRCPYRGLCLKERVPNAPPEWLAAWEAITAAELRQDLTEMEDDI